MRTLLSVIFVALGIAFFRTSWAYVPNNADDGEDSIRKSPRDLVKTLFENYDKNVRPVKKHTDTITTRVGLSPIFIRELDEEKEILVLDTWIVMDWNDNYLVWNPDNNDGIKTLHIPSLELWRPDVTIYTASPDKNLLPQVFTDVILNHTGIVLWVPPVTISTRCALDLSEYPYDTQHCLIKLGSWTNDKSAMDVQPYSTFITLNDFADNNPNWSLIGATAERVESQYPCCPNQSYPSLNFNLTLRRKISAPVEIAQSISYYAGFLALIMFWLPADSVYKVLLGAIAESLLALTVLYVGTVIPTPIARMKAAGKIYPVMCAVSAALIVEVLVMNLARVMGPCRPPRCLLAVAKGCCTMFGVCISRPYPGGDLPVKIADTEKMEKYLSSAQEEWNLVAMALDRALFLVAVVVSVFLYNLW